MSAPPAYLTVIRTDLPRWLNWPSGALYTGRSRFALLIGGRARRLAIPCGIQTFTVVVHSLLLGVHEIRVILTVEEGGDYRYECRCRRDAYTKALLSSALYVMSIMLSCWIGSVISPVLREPMLELLPTIFAMSITGPASRAHTAPRCIGDHVRAWWDYNRRCCVPLVYYMAPSRIVPAESLLS